MAKHKSFAKSRSDRKRKPVELSFDWEHLDKYGNPYIKEYNFAVKPSFAMMESIGGLEQEIAERTQGDPDLQSIDNQGWVFAKTGEILELMLGEENWKSLKHDLEVEDAMELIQWIGDELGSERQDQAADDPEGEAEGRKEIGPDDVPEEGKQSEDLTSLPTTS